MFASTKGASAKTVEYVVFSQTVSPYIGAMIYENALAYLYQAPVSPPPSASYGVAITPAADAIFATYNTAGAVVAYPFSASSGFGVPYSAPSETISGKGYAVAVSPEGEALIVGSDTTPYVHSYQWSSRTGFGTKFGNPSSLPSGGVYRIAFSSTGNFVVLAINQSPWIEVYDWSYLTGFGAKWTKTSLVDYPGIAGTAPDISIHPDNTYVAVAGSNVTLGDPKVCVYSLNPIAKRLGSSYTPYSSFDMNILYGCEFSKDGSAIVVYGGDAPFFEAVTFDVGGGTYYDPMVGMGANDYSNDIAFTENGDVLLMTQGTNSPLGYIGIRGCGWSATAGFGNQLPRIADTTIKSVTRVVVVKDPTSI